MIAPKRPFTRTIVRVLSALAIGLTGAQAYATSPSIPADLSATTDSGNVTLSWTASTDDDAVAGYNVYRNDQYLTTVFDTNYTLSQEQSVGNSFYVVAFDTPSAGETRAYSARSTVLQVSSDELTTDTPPTASPGGNQAPTAPTALSAQRGSETSVELMWSGASDDVAVVGYNVYRDDAYRATVFGTGYIDVSAQPGATHVYYLIAFDEPRQFSARSPSVTVQGTVGSTAIIGVTATEPTPETDTETESAVDTQAPDVVTGLNATNVTDEAVTLVWDVDTSDTSIRGYNVYRNGQYFTTVFDARFVDSSLPSDDAVSYSIVAFDNAPNYSSVSAEIRVDLTATLSETDLTPNTETETGTGDFGSEPRPPTSDEMPPALPDPFAGPIPGPSFADPFNTLLELDNEAPVAGGAPTTPKNLRIELVANDWAELSWAPANDDGEVVAYKLYRSDGVIYDIERDQISLNTGIQAELDKIWRTTSFIDCNFTRFFDTIHFCEVNQPVPGETYTYQISAIDDDGQESPRSNELTITYHKDRGAPIPRYQDPYLASEDDFAQRNDLSETRFFLDEFTTVFEDEFTGDTIDASKWTTELIAADNIINGEQQYFVNTQEQPDFGYDPFTFTGDSLIIEAIPVPDELRNSLPPVCDEPDPTGLDRCEFLSGALSSHSNDGSSNFQFLYGYAEGRMRASSAFGALSSFYLFHRYPGTGIQRQGPEIDILEYLGENPFGDEDAFQTYHYENPLTGDIMSSPTMNFENPTGELYSDDFHTYGVLWEPSLVIWYIDGVEIKRLTGPQVGRSPKVIVNYLVAGSAWAPTPDAANPDLFPLQYEVDYIRVMQRDLFEGAGFAFDQEDVSR